MRLTENLLIRQLLELHLPPDDFAVFGSGPLLAHGLKKSVSDLDIVAGRRAWKRARSIARPEPAASGVGKVVKVPGKPIEIFNAWPIGQSTNWLAKLWARLRTRQYTKRLIAEAKPIDGVKFVSLEKVLAWKQAAGRGKDDVDIELIRRYLERS